MYLHGRTTLSFTVTVEDGAKEIINQANVDGLNTNTTKVPVVSYEKTAEIIRQTEEEIPDGAVTAADKIKYTITINNLGEETVDSITIKDEIPEGTTVSKVENDGKENGKQEITWKVLNLEPNSSKVVSFVVTVNYDKQDTKTITNIASIDGKETNKVETIYQKPAEKVEANLEKTGTDIITAVGDKVTYKLTYNATIKDFVGEAKLH